MAESSDIAVLEVELSKSASAVEKALDDLLPSLDGHEGRVVEAMRYAALAGGKRLRPFLVLSSASLFDVDEDRAMRVACALECVHTYSLIHDDLPCMDDDDMRRGQPTTHVEFDEATAVLAGDALLTIAFEILADVPTHEDARVRCELVSALARESGAHGMVGGQMIDILAEEMTLDMGGVTRLQQMKTGALIRFGAASGAIMGRASSELRHALHAYAHDIGLAFQIVDDLLDVEGDAEKMGKAVGKDHNKATFVSLMGQDRARTQAEMLAEQARIHLDPFDNRADLLRLLPQFVITRRS